MLRRAEDDWVEAKVANGRSLGEGDCGLGIRMGGVGNKPLKYFIRIL